MSSSIFIEPSASQKDGKEDGKHNPDSNLVVVYGKNGINIDPKDLEALIEEKAAQTISVIRITSPTPSMEEAEEAARLEAAKDAAGNSSDSDDGGSDSESAAAVAKDAAGAAGNHDSSGVESEDGGADNSSTEQNTEKNDSDSDEKNFEKSTKLSRRYRNDRRNVRTNIKNKIFKKQKSTEVRGLTLEGFYEADAALEIAKEACKMAGIPFIRNTAEYEFMLFVIRNDHCYTPYTSPEQMKAKLAADKLETEKLNANIRKVQPQILINSQSKLRKLPMDANLANSLHAKLGIKKTQNEDAAAKMRGAQKHEKPRNLDNSAELEQKASKAAAAADDDDFFELIDIEDSDYTGSDVSAESDNDRDSDLDFNVNNRQTSKHKRKVSHSSKKPRRLLSTKVQDARRNNKDEEASSGPTSSSGQSVTTTNAQRPTFVVKSRIISNNLSTTNVTRQINQNAISKENPPPPPAVTAGTGTGKSFPKPNLSPAAAPPPLRTGQIVHIGNRTTATATATMQQRSNVERSPSTSQQTAVKEIVINKVLSSPKGCFTELTTLISEAEKTSSQTSSSNMLSQPPTTPTSCSTRNLSAAISSSTTPSRTGFMRIDGTGKSVLPAQISVQTHQSSSELAAEHDKQLDLIDSIVTDELNKSLENIIEQPTTTTTSITSDENIPKLVKMLENTEKALESSNCKLTTNAITATTTPHQQLDQHCIDSTTTTNTSTNAANVDDIVDISHDLPEDLLQHVVELMKDDKTLQEAVEKEILEQESIQQMQSKSGISSGGHTNVRQIQLVQQQSPLVVPHATIPPSSSSTSKSIIEMSISNTDNYPLGSNQSRSSPLIRRDPIQIVRGNGRVITLPPIEAPTTRAKRRAQVIPNSAGQQQQQSMDSSSLQIMNETSLDNSLQSNASFGSISVSKVGGGAAAAVTETMGSAIETKTPAKRRTSKEGGTKSARKNTGSNRKRKQQDDNEASESQGDDDDPKRLWCICRQPHNNRFMICCDACGDWFHGTCVNVTKAMGREMEQKGIEWSCPQCIKKRDERTQRKLTDMLPVKQIPSHNEEKLKLPTVELKPMPVETHDYSAAVATASLKKEAFEIKKGGGNVQQFTVLTLPVKKGSIVQNQGQKKIVVSSPSVSISHLKGKVIVSTQPVRAVTTLTSNMARDQQQQHVQQVQQAVNRVVSESKPIKPMQPQKPTTPCALCKKPARPNTIYCSDDCIRRSAQIAINAYTAKSSEQESVVSASSSSGSGSSSTPDDKKKKAKGLFEDLLSMADRKPKVERITVYDRVRRIKLSGSNAPTTLTIRKWLHENPSFEVVLPGSQLSIDIEKHQQHQQQHQQQQVHITPKHVGQIRNINLKLSTTTPTLNRSNQSLSAGVHQVQTLPSTAVSPPPAPAKTLKKIIEEHKAANAVNSPRPNTPKQLQKYPQQAQIRSDSKSPRNEPTKDQDNTKSSSSKDRQLKRQSSDVSTSSNNSQKKSTAADSTAAAAAAASSSNFDTEPVRKNVRRTLKEQILQRMNEAASNSPEDGDADADGDLISTNNMKLTAEEVDSFVKETEEEMFTMFHRDAGTKYKAKYRSLMFNIKDRKNRTLFAKICAKQIEPKQLVHMSPEELASQELAQWRQNENKHQLEMIKKSELDLLSCSKSYVFKNHKGEEMIESKEADCVNLDLTIPVEDVVNVLNNSAGSSSGNNESSKDATELENTSSGGYDQQQQIDHHHHSFNENLHLHHAQASDHHYHHLSHKEQGSGASAADNKVTEDKSKSRSSATNSRRHRSKSRDLERDRERRQQRSKSKESEKDRERNRSESKRHRSRERHHRDKSRPRRKSHSRSRSRSRSAEKRHKSSSHSSSYKDDHNRERDHERDRERKDKKSSDRQQQQQQQQHQSSSAPASSISTKVSSQLKEKHRSSPVPTTTTTTMKHKTTTTTAQEQQQKSLECFNLIDQIIESTKTVEEAANLVKDAKVKDKPKESQQQQQQQSPVVATSSSSIEISAAASAAAAASTASKSQTNSSQNATDSDQEPTSTVIIPTPPHDPFAGNDEEASFSRNNSPGMEELWSGGLSMNDVASLQIKLCHLIGNSRNIGKYMAENLDVVGRIDGNTVWEYLYKIKKSPNKEIVLLRMMPYCEDDFDGYTKLFEYLDLKKRLGVIKSIMPQIKDFYIYPLGAGKHLPKVLQVSSGDEFYNDPFRPDMIVGVIVRVIGKRITAQPPPQPSNVTANSVVAHHVAAKLVRRHRDESDSFTPPGSPKRRKHTHKGSIDLDAIIKAPMIKKPNPTAMDADEPYSPGGSSDDDIIAQYSGKVSSLGGLPNADEELKRKMEEINRQIAAQEMEIAGLLNVEPAASASVLANISIPSNLPQILASIKNKDPSAPMPMPSSHPNNEEYIPKCSSSTLYTSSARQSSAIAPSSSSSSSTSRLAQLTEAELLSMVPDDIILDPVPSSSKKPYAVVPPYHEEPPPPGI